VREAREARSRAAGRGAPRGREVELT
jgi:hypothetical protein